MKRGANGGRWLLAGTPLAFLATFVAAPLAIMVLASFQYPGEYGGLMPVFENGDVNLTLENYAFFFSDFIFTEVLLKSAGYALATTLVCLAMAYPLASLMASSPRRRRDLMVLLVILPFASNFLIRVYAWMIILGPESAISHLLNGTLEAFGMEPVRLLFSPFAVLVGLVYVHLPFMVLPLYANLEKHDPVLIDAARDLGATPLQCFTRITWPLSLPGVFSGCALVFIPVLGMFAVPDILGGTGDLLIGNIIKDQFLATRDWPFGSTLSMVLSLWVLGVVWLAARLARRPEVVRA